MAHCIRFAVVAVVSFLFACRAPAAEPLLIELESKSTTNVDVIGLSTAELAAIDKLGLRGDARASLFAVYVVPAPGKDLGPPVSGELRVEGKLLRFAPRYPFVPGVRYRAIFTPSAVPGRVAQKEVAIVKEFALAKPKLQPTRLTHIYPTTDHLPENQLKFYLHFSAPMGRGRIYRHIKLLDEQGHEVEFPFLELDEELWDGAQQRVTIFCDPGRIKRGLKPREEFGPVLQEGKRYTLVIDAGFKDANGNDLKEAVRKSFSVLPPDDTQPDPKSWKVQVPKAASREALIVTSPKPLDQALLERLVWLVDSKGRKLPGTVSVTRAETEWRFVPVAAWEQGRYELVADTRLEDLAGNSIAKPFEVDVFHPVERNQKSQAVRIPIEIKPAGNH